MTHDGLRSTLYNWLFLSAVIALGICAYSNTIFGFFLSDDFPQIRQCLISGFKALIPSGSVKFLRPMMYLSLLFDVNMWGLNPVGFHCQNLVLHSGASILTGFAMWLLLRLLSSDFPARSMAWCAALLFMLMPCHSEPVAWISGRVDLLAAFFALASLCAYLSSLRSERGFWYPISLGLFFLALLSKESVLTFPFVILVLRLLVGQTTVREGSPRPGKMAGIFGFFVVIGLYVVIRHVALGTLVGGYGDRIHTNLNLDAILSVVGKAPLKALFPLQLLRLLPIRRWMLIPVVAALLGMTCSALWVICRKGSGKFRWYNRFHRKPEFVLFSGSVPLFLAALGPVVNLSVSINTMGNDRYLYFPSVFAAFLLTAALYLCVANSRIRNFFLASILVAYGVSLYHLNENWRIAASIAQNIVHDLRENASTAPVLIVNMPDNYNDAYVFRNGLEDAVAMFHSTAVARNIKVVSFQSLSVISAGADLNCSAKECVVTFKKSMHGPLHHPYAFWINGGGPRDANEAAKLSVKGTFSTDSYRVFDVWERGFKFVSIGDTRQAPCVFYYTDGRLIPLTGDISVGIYKKRDR